MTGLYPRIEPYRHGMLEVGEGNRVSWETCGNPQGKPAVVVHGGPGSGRSTWDRRLFDPTAYLIVQFDQRGCGRSTPHASDPDVDLTSNTTQNLWFRLPHLSTILRRPIGHEELLEQCPEVDEALT